MDSLTHIVLGGCLGHLALGKKAGRKAVVWGAIADTIPDLDVFAGFWVHPVDSLLIHRGFTHSILFAILCSIFGGFSNIRFAYTTIFIADPAFTLPMLMAFVVLLRKKPSIDTKTTWAKYAIVISSIYLVWTFINRSHFETLFKNQFQVQKLSISDQSLTPGPLNNISS